MTSSTLPCPTPPVVTVRKATDAERVALHGARWRGLPPWAASAAMLRVAIAGKREVLLGCGWEADSGEEIQTGIALSPETWWRDATLDALTATIRPHPLKPLLWTEWQELSDPQTGRLLARGFQSSKRLMNYEIPILPETRGRMAAGVDLARRRLADAGLNWGDLSDPEAIAAVRQGTAEEGLITPTNFDFLHRAGELDADASTVVWQGGKIGGFMVMMARETFEVLLLVVRRDLRSTGVNALLIWETARKKLAKHPDAGRIVFRGNPVNNPGSRRLCLRFGGQETTACLKLVLPPAP